MRVVVSVVVSVVVRVVVRGSEGAKGGQGWPGVARGGQGWPGVARGSQGWPGEAWKRVITLGVDGASKKVGYEAVNLGVLTRGCLVLQLP